MSASNNNETAKRLKVFITSREMRIFDGTCTSVTSYNDVGEFDILPRHSNFICLIQKYVILNKNGANLQKFNIDKGVLTVANDAIEVYVQE